MGSFCETLEMWFELMTRVLCDVRPPRQADIMYLYGQSPDNQDSVLDKGVASFNANQVARIGICGNEKGYGYEGGDTWFDELVRKGISQPDAVVRIPRVEEKFPPCTDSEAEGLIRSATQNQWGVILVTGSPLHQVRAFVSTISAMRRAGADLKVYNCVGELIDWLQQTAHSQGTTVGIRKDLLAGEFGRLNRYHDKGDLLSAKEVLDYLNQR